MPDRSTHWFVINLDRSPDRLALIEESFAACGLPFTRVPAVDGRALAAPPEGLDPDRYRRTHGRDVQAGEIGCYFSHLKVFDAFLATPAEFAMVLEDDVRVTPEVCRLVDDLTAPGAPDDWDLVKFEAHHKSVPLALRPLRGPYRLCAMLTRSTGSAAYLVNRTAAAILREHLLPMVVPYDHAFDRGWAAGIRVRTIVPFPIARAEFKTTVAVTTFRKLPPWQKGPTLLWRAGTETMRVLSAFHSWARPTRRFPWPGTRRPRAAQPRPTST
ncbi:MAG: glycosyltransferase family 25 protein [Parafilimonas terrae]|nr:glycosyltransferase family 25 protein [Parafilimonas terrae]